jgi:hypothetical protein
MVVKFEDFTQYLERNNVPYGQWGKSVHLLAARSQDNLTILGSMEETSTAAARTYDTARDRRIDYGRFDWAKALSFDTENSEDDSIEFETSLNVRSPDTSETVPDYCLTYVYVSLVHPHNSACVEPVDRSPRVNSSDYEPLNSFKYETSDILHGV